MRKFQVVIFMSLALLFPQGIAVATTYAEVSGRITSSDGTPITTPAYINLIVKGSNTQSNLNANGQYSVNVPINTNFELIVVIFQKEEDDDQLIATNGIRTKVGFSNWSTSVSGISEDKRIDLQIPLAFRISIKVTDAQSNVLSNIGLKQIDGNQMHDDYVYGGRIWAGIQGFSSRHQVIYSTSGQFVFYAYKASFFKGYRYWQFKDMDDRAATSGFLETPSFSLSSDENIQICLPVNFGASRATPASCLENIVKAKNAETERMEAEKAARDKAASDKAETDFKNSVSGIASKIESDVAAINKIIADQKSVSRKKIVEDIARRLKSLMVSKPDLRVVILKSQNSLNAISLSPSMLSDSAFEQSLLPIEKQLQLLERMTTLVCQKGKEVKKVSALKPKCPAGYRKK